ncbi:FAD-linked oxidoreductase YvdP [Diaporthe eres]|nr:FAD-linked oxidoreductase YvdP [Diaporthe eres]
MFQQALAGTQAQMVNCTSVIALLGAAWTAVSQTFGPQSRTCRCYPGDQCWPSATDWESFNQTLGGKLIRTVPIASPCHDTFPGVKYDAATCANIQANWVRPTLHDVTSHSPMAPIFANESCDPFTGRDAQCIIGSYVQYTVNATGAPDYMTTLDFARKRNVRLVIRNTGHDYLGKSTGAGAIALWTHHLKDMAVLDYSSTAYSGKAMKMGAGVQAAEAQAVANAAGLVVVAGDCPTVGIAGGYTQGGGTSPLGSKFGLAADQVLEWEVVTPDGKILTATPDQNSDLYWALTGGGGGTYGIVLSMTVKLHQDMSTGGATLSFTGSSDKFWDAVRMFLMNLPAIVDAGATVYWWVVPGNTFVMPQSYLPNGTAQDLERLLKPTLDALNQSGITYAFSSKNYPAFQDAFHTMNPEMNITELNTGGRLIPRSLVSSNGSAARLSRTINHVLHNNGTFIGVSENVGKSPTSNNSVHPYWRETVFLAVFGITYDEYNLTANYAAQQTVTNVLVPALAELTPNGATYLNEADFNEPNWQETFYGSNYPRLLSIKQKYDPYGILWDPATKFCTTSPVSPNT